MDIRHQQAVALWKRLWHKNCWCQQASVNLFYSLHKSHPISIYWPLQVSQPVGAVHPKLHNLISLKQILCVTPMRTGHLAEKTTHPLPDGSWNFIIT